MFIVHLFGKQTQCYLQRVSKQKWWPGSRGAMQCAVIPHHAISHYNNHTVTGVVLTAQFKLLNGNIKLHNNEEKNPMHLRLWEKLKTVKKTGLWGEFAMTLTALMWRVGGGKWRNTVNYAGKLMCFELALSGNPYAIGFTEIPSVENPGTFYGVILIKLRCSFFFKKKKQ